MSKKSTKKPKRRLFHPENFTHTCDDVGENGKCKYCVMCYPVWPASIQAEIDEINKEWAERGLSEV